MGIGKAILAGLNVIAESMMSIYKSSEIETLNNARKILVDHMEDDAVRAIDDVLEKAVVNPTPVVNPNHTNFLTRTYFRRIPDKRKVGYPSIFDLMDDVKRDLDESFHHETRYLYSINSHIFAKSTFNKDYVSILFTHRLDGKYDDNKVPRINIDKYGLVTISNMEGVTIPHRQEYVFAIKSVLRAIGCKTLGGWH